MYLTNPSPGYYLPRGKYKRRKPGKQPEAARVIMAQEKAIVERNRADTEKLKKEQANEQGTLPQAP